jgi:hypothetical protein
MGNGEHLHRDGTEAAERADRWKKLPPRVEATATGEEVEPVVPGSISHAPDWERDAMLKYGVGGI